MIMATRKIATNMHLTTSLLCMVNALSEGGAGYAATCPQCGQVGQVSHSHALLAPDEQDMREGVSLSCVISSRANSQNQEVW
jgi:hypothetical protein